MEETEPLEAAEAEVAAASDGPPAGASTAAGTAPLPPSDGSSTMPQIRQVRHARSSSFQRWRSQMLRAWKWGPGNGGSGLAGGGREQSLKAMVNFEMMVNQKRQWYQIKAKARDHSQNKEPMSLYEHFFIVGLHSNANVEAVEAAFAKRKIWESEVAKSEILDLRKHQYHGCMPTLEPQILFKYPPGKRATMREYEVPTFCFPEGVKARLIQRTPSMSDLNEIVFGQEHLSSDDFAFVFCLKSSDNAPLYGVCLHIQEIVQRAPGILGAVSPLPHSSCKSSRFLVAAPRCYCLLTRVPFFELHYEMLNSIIAQERLDRITHYVSEMALTESISHGVSCFEQLSENSEQLFSTWMDYAIPVDTVSGLVSSSVIPVEREVSSSPYRSLEPQSPESVSASDASDFSHLRELDRETRRTGPIYDDNTSETSGSRSDSFERLNGCFENGHASPDIGMSYACASGKLQRVESLESVYSGLDSSFRSVGSDDDEEEELNSKNETNVADEKVMEWAKANNNEPLQIVCGYHALPLPPRGGEIIFHPLDHLQPIKYCRPGMSSLGLDAAFADVVPLSPKEVNEILKPRLFNKVNARLAAAEEALALSIWTTATICRALSLESVGTLYFFYRNLTTSLPDFGTLSWSFIGKTSCCHMPKFVLLKQLQGMLSAIVLSIIPMIRPFQWHSLFLPLLEEVACLNLNGVFLMIPCEKGGEKWEVRKVEILPRKMLDFVDAPVPYIVGLMHKPTDIQMKISNLVQINVYKDKVKSCSLPQLPRYKELISDLGPIHARFSSENPIAKRHPVYKCSEVQAEAARQFLDAMASYLESFCSNLRSHTITNVQSNNDKVSLLLKDSFVDSFPAKDRPFIKYYAIVEEEVIEENSSVPLCDYQNPPGLELNFCFIVL
ncbi:hypothetical protein ZIOFF_033741 [Zingiber officinale]|uniref:cDENN domain-containing protein n=1 Tax=Zingiber officinale TaxID=94328 RepID=A0A8J5GMX1_ZINOF|nr:hypothetical protein ZIOFF_033741 [Zingiber officinale]